MFLDIIIIGASLILLVIIILKCTQKYRVHKEQKRREKREALKKRIKELGIRKNS